MNNKTQRSEIQIETHELTIIRRSGRRLAIYCERCRSLVAAFTPAETARIFQTPVSQVRALTESGEIHFIETAGGKLSLICGGLPGKKNKF